MTVRQSGSERLGTVFYVSLAISVAFILTGVFFTDQLVAFNEAALGVVTTSFGWIYLLATTAFVFLLLFMALSRFGDIRLGADDDRPQFGTLSWLAMLFSAGMGIGLVFYGVAEPVSHLHAPPLQGEEPGTVDAARLAMQYTFFHWGVHAWALYGLVGLALAYFRFRRGSTGLVSAVFEPLLGDKVNGPIGKAIDILAVFVTALGVATSFGIGASQINGGLNYVFGVPETVLVQSIIIAVVFVLFQASALSGLDKGIKILSNLNIALMGAIALFFLLVGPRTYLFNTFVASLGNYMQNFMRMSFTSGAFASPDGQAWLQGWTIFYWAWWMMWVMWVGTFVARISKGRTIREFVAGVLVVPTAMSCAWFAILGGTGTYLDLYQGGNIGKAVTENINTAIFVTLDHYPFALPASILVMLLIASFFVTSADSAAFVLAMQTTGGNENPSNLVKAVWGVVIAVFAFVLLLAGGLDAVQQVAILTGVPFTVLLIAMAVSLYKAVSSEYVPAPAGRRPVTASVVASSAEPSVVETTADPAGPAAGGSHPA